MNLYIRFAVLALGAMSLFSCKWETQLCQYDIKLLETNRYAIRNGAVCPSYDKLIKNADKLLGQEALSVTQKGMMPPSGDKHDYMSQAPYWWPNPDTADGLPYVRIDGKINPEKDLLTDFASLGIISKGIHTLGLAYFFSGEEKYAQKATELARVWFIDPETRMNPNLNFAQRVPGQCDGRGIGIIETRNFVQTVDGISLIEGSRSWTPKLDRAIKAWMLEYRDWLLDSDNGKNENSQPNNHGTSYDAQVLALSLFTGSTERAIQYMKDNVHKRFDEIRADGVAPREMARATSWSYHAMNCNLLASLGNIAAKYDEDYFHYVNVNGVTFEKMFNFYGSIFSGELKWEGDNLRPGKSVGSFGEALLAASSHYWTAEETEKRLDAANSFCDKPFPKDDIYWLLFWPLK